MAVLTDGQADVVSIDGNPVTLQEIGGRPPGPAVPRLARADADDDHRAAPEFGNFNREGFAAGQLIQLSGFDGDVSHRQHRRRRHLDDRRAR